jgi:hypothetical protein
MSSSSDPWSTEDTESNEELMMMLQMATNSKSKTRNSSLSGSGSSAFSSSTGGTSSSSVHSPLRSFAAGEMPKGAVVAPISQELGEDETGDDMTLGPEWLTTGKRSGGHAHAHSLVHGSSGGMRAHFTRQQIVDMHKPFSDLPLGFNPLPFVTSEESLQPMFSLPDVRVRACLLIVSCVNDVRACLVCLLCARISCAVCWSL